MRSTTITFYFELIDHLFNINNEITDYTIHISNTVKNEATAIILPYTAIILPYTLTVSDQLQMFEMCGFPLIAIFGLEELLLMHLPLLYKTRSYDLHPHAWSCVHS